MEAGLEVNTEKTQYMFVPRHQNARRNQHLKIATKSYVSVPK
jgi:hypothetical protein